MQRKVTFILFDIDGTLINPGAAGRRSITRVFHEMFSLPKAFRDLPMSGKTDVQIIKEGLSLHGLPPGEEILSAILSAYTRILKKEIQRGKKHILPGVPELLNALKTTDGYRVGLLTGNIQEGARIKLGAFDLNRFFPVGAFGDDHEDRNQLLPIVLERFRKMTGLELDYRDCVVIGDTPMDVACAKPYGATAIAVSTGSYGYETLLETGADYVLKDLTTALDDLDIFNRRSR